MKLLIGNGNILEARDVGPVIYRLRARPGGPPIKFHDAVVLEDDAARAALSEVWRTGLYDRDVP